MFTFFQTCPQPLYFSFDPIVFHACACFDQCLFHVLEIRLWTVYTVSHWLFLDTPDSQIKQLHPMRDNTECIIIKNHLLPNKVHYSILQSILEMWTFKGLLLEMYEETLEIICKTVDITGTVHCNICCSKFSSLNFGSFKPLVCHFCFFGNLLMIKKLHSFESQKQGWENISWIRCINNTEELRICQEGLGNQLHPRNTSL